jgi:hypothetical protein
MYARKYTKKAHDREDAAQQGMLFGAKILGDSRVDESKRSKYAKLQVYYGVLDYVRSKLCPFRIRKKNGKIVHQVNYVKTDALPKIDIVPDEKWRRDLKAIEAKMDFDALIAKLEKRLGGRGDRQRSPVLRLVAACGGVRAASRATNLAYDTLRLHIKKAAL